MWGCLRRAVIRLSCQHILRSGSCVIVTWNEVDQFPGLWNAPQGHRGQVGLVNSSTQESSIFSHAEHLHVLYIPVPMIYKICMKCLLYQVVAERSRREAGKAPRRDKCQISAHWRCSVPDCRYSGRCKILALAPENCSLSNCIMYFNASLIRSNLCEELASQ